MGGTSVAKVLKGKPEVPFFFFKLLITVEPGPNGWHLGRQSR